MALCVRIGAETLAFPRRSAVAADAAGGIDARFSRSADRCGGSAGMDASVKTQRTCFPFNPQATEWHAGHLRTVWVVLLRKAYNPTGGIIGSALGARTARPARRLQAGFPSVPNSRRITATPATSAFE